MASGDFRGTRHYADDRICSALEITTDDYVLVRNALIDKDLIAFDGTRFQVLSLPPQPITAPRPPLLTQRDFERDDPATIRQIIRSSLDNS